MKDKYVREKVAALRNQVGALKDQVYCIEKNLQRQIEEINRNSTVCLARPEITGLYTGKRYGLADIFLKFLESQGLEVRHNPSSIDFVERTSNDSSDKDND